MKKRGIVSSYLPWILIAIAVLAIVMITLVVLRQEGLTLIDKIKSLFIGR